MTSSLHRHTSNIRNMEERERKSLLRQYKQRTQIDPADVVNPMPGSMEIEEKYF